MSLDNIKLSPFLIQEMYEHSLIDTGLVPAPEKEKNTAKAAPVKPKTKPEEPIGAIKHLGNNSRNILILISEKDHAFLADEDLGFLMNILNACKISVEDTALVNCYGNAAAIYGNLQTQFSPAIVLFLGTQPHELDFPVQIPFYRIQQYNKQQYLCAPSLKTLSADKEEKKQLWNALKILFSIA